MRRIAECRVGWDEFRNDGTERGTGVSRLGAVPPEVNELPETCRLVVQREYLLAVVNEDAYNLRHGYLERSSQGHDPTD